MTSTTRPTPTDPAPDAAEPDGDPGEQSASPPTDCAAAPEATAPETGTTGTHRVRRRRLRAVLHGDGGMSTVEYAIGTVAAAAFAAILYAVVSGDSIVGALTGIVQRALAPTF